MNPHEKVRQLAEHYRAKRTAPRADCGGPGEPMPVPEEDVFRDPYAPNWTIVAERILRERREAREALERYGMHDYDCPWHLDKPEFPDLTPCTCGLEEAKGE